MASIPDRTGIHKALIIQTASAGDVILATPVVEKLHHDFPDAQIDFMLKRGNEALLKNHPYLNELIIRDKGEGKFKELFRILKKVRKTKYDLIVNIQRFFFSGLITAFSGAKRTTGFSKNPFSLFFNISKKHIIEDGVHETVRNLSLIEDLSEPGIYPVRLYPAGTDFKAVEQYKTKSYICIAPASLWFTKQLPPVKWTEFADEVDEEIQIFFLGSPNDYEICNEITRVSTHKNCVNLAGKLTFLQTAALMKNAMMNYVNDSAPMHLASAMDAPVTAVFCSTVPAFGFGPLSSASAVVETRENLACRPCGLHGRDKCPEGHFKCAMTIRNQDLLERLQK